MLLAEPSRFNRALLRNQLEMAGYSVLEGSDINEIKQRVESESIDVLVTATELARAAKTSLLQRTDKFGSARRIPSLTLTENSAELDANREDGEKWNDYQLRFDRDAMLRSVGQLSRSLAAREPVEAEA